jgi:uncharacterized protein YcfL
MIKKIFIKYFDLIILVVTIITLTLFISGCASREESPVKLDDSTVVYPSKYKNGILAKITLSNKISKKTGKPIKGGTVFRLEDKAKLFAVADLENKAYNNQQDLMFHIDWLDSSGNSFYKKRIDISPVDSVSSITSSISVAPQKRKAGNYIVRVYLFRELIAEKKFRLVESIADTVSIEKKNKPEKKKKSEVKVENQKTVTPIIKTDSITANIILCKKISKKTGKPIGVGTVFTIDDKAKVKAVVNFQKQEIKTNEQLKFYFNWIGPDGKSFYKKRMVYTTSNPSFTLTNSISITPGKRQPGSYILRISFRKKIIAEQKFELVDQTK